MARHKKGQILLLTLIILTIGAIILGGLFLYLNTSQSASGRSEERALTYYAADSGFEDGYFFLQQAMNLTGWNTGDNLWWRCSGCEPTDPDPINDEIVDSINVSIVEDIDTQIYKITSIATTHSGESTTVESHILASTLDLTPFGGDAITSNGSVKMPGKPGIVQGNVTYVTELDCGGLDCQDSVNGTIRQDPDGIDWWPYAEQLNDYFESFVGNAPHFTDGSIIDVSITPNIGPLYGEGNLDIKSMVDGVDDATLNGIVYVTGDLHIGGAKDFTLNLSGQTIFVVGTGGNQPAIIIDQDCHIDGSGAIIAIGDIKFLPSIDSGTDDFMFIMSVEGEVIVQPQGSFWGSVAGNTNVRVQPNTLVGHFNPQDVGYELPGVEPIFDVLTYNIIK